MSPTSSTLTSSLCQKFDEMKSFRCQEIGYYPLLPIGKKNRLIFCMDIYQREPGVSIYMFVYVHIKAKTAKYVMPLITVSTFEQTDAPMEMSRRRFAK